MRTNAVVAGVYLVTQAMNYAGLMLMALACSLSWREFKALRDASVLARLAAPVREAMRHPPFWIGWWVSLAGLVINTLTPLALFATLPAWSVLPIFAAVFASNVVLSVPFRLALLSTRRMTR